MGTSVAEQKRKGPRWRDLPWDVQEDLCRRRDRNREDAREWAAVRRAERQKNRPLTHSLTMKHLVFRLYCRLPTLFETLDRIVGNRKRMGYGKGRCLARAIHEAYDRAEKELQRRGEPIPDWGIERTKPKLIEKKRPPVKRPMGVDGPESLRPLSPPTHDVGAGGNHV